MSCEESFLTAFRYLELLGKGTESRNTDPCTTHGESRHGQQVQNYNYTGGHPCTLSVPTPSRPAASIISNYLWDKYYNVFTKGPSLASIYCFGQNVLKFGLKKCLFIKLSQILIYPFTFSNITSLSHPSTKSTPPPPKNGWNNVNMQYLNVSLEYTSQKSKLLGTLRI